MPTKVYCKPAFIAYLLVRVVLRERPSSGTAAAARTRVDVHVAVDRVAEVAVAVGEAGVGDDLLPAAEAVEVGLRPLLVLVVLAAVLLHGYGNVRFLRRASNG